jgi:hypothetical protein
LRLHESPCFLLLNLDADWEGKVLLTATPEM